MMSNVTDKIRKRILQLGIVAATMAPVSNAQASSETSKDNDNYNNTEMVNFREVQDRVYSNEGDPIILNTLKSKKSNKRFFEINEQKNKGF